VFPAFGIEHLEHRIVGDVQLLRRVIIVAIQLYPIQIRHTICSMVENDQGSLIKETSDIIMWCIHVRPVFVVYRLYRKTIQYIVWQHNWRRPCVN
jgi:hypothetical protein